MKNRELDIPENIPVITPEMIAKTAIELTKSWSGLHIGSMVKKKEIFEDESCYIFLGLVEEGQIVERVLNKIVELSPRKKMGWFTPYPLELNEGGVESDIPVFAWFTDMFEEIK